MHQSVQLAAFTERLYYLVSNQYGHRQTSSFTRAHILLKHSTSSANDSFLPGAARRELCQVRLTAAQRVHLNGALMSKTTNSNNSAGRFGQGDGGYQSRRPNPYAQQDDGNRYEMSNYSNNNPNNGYAPSGGGSTPAANGDMSAFWAEVRTALLGG